MREIHDKINGDVTITEDTALYGQINGNVAVQRAAGLSIYGQLNGSLRVEPKARAAVFGHVNGDVLNDGSVEIRGMVNGDVVEGEASETVIHAGAIVSRSR